MSHVAEGERAYIVDTDAYGDIQRTTFLGKTGAVFLNDDGTLGALTDSKIKSSVVSTVTGQNGLGEVVETPMDVKKDGVSILSELSVVAESQALLFVKFMGMFTKEERRAYMEDWAAKKDDPEQKALFLDGIMADLDDDSAFISNEGNKVLINVESDVRQKMFEKLLVDVDKTTRESYILEWVGVKNDKDSKEEFLQKIYELLMEDDDYIQMEGKKALSQINISQADQEPIFANFLQSTSAQERADHITEWKKVRKSRSQRNFFLKNFLKLYGTD